MLQRKQSPVLRRLKQRRSVIDPTTDGAILHNLFKQIKAIDCGPPTQGSDHDPTKWNFFMTRYLRDPRNRVKNDRRSQSSARGNIHKELQKGSMSWKVFLKGMRFLRVKHFVIQFEVYHHDGNFSKHRATLTITGDQSQLSEFNDAVRDPSPVFNNPRIDKEGEVLSKLWTSIMEIDCAPMNPSTGTRNYSPHRWKQFMDAYIQDPVNGFEPDRRSQSSARGNIHKELMKENMTWRVFMKGQRWLQVKQFTIRVMVMHVTGQVSNHAETIRLRDDLNTNTKRTF